MGSSVIDREAAVLRLKRLRQERDAILAAFPDLRAQTPLRRTQRHAGRLVPLRTTRRRTAAKL